ncbi:hypothetical protein Pyn_06791 [Prunus yedoensis var. nudiflora]|uniref:Uncharacterized protein n=1 Tax=Prunus yedoensis var. nudiflora TaxID=2094558 RepID=A0A314Y7Z0_PRUYE|nr:hypothetical protein Pyn_06791 [Prunus yedoensis var. nudiflora]
MPERDERDSLSKAGIFSFNSVRKREIRQREKQPEDDDAFARLYVASTAKSKLLFRKPRWVSNRVVAVATNVEIRRTKA